MRTKDFILILALGACLGGADATTEAQQVGELTGTVLDEAKVPVRGAVCNLSGGSLPQQGVEVVTGQDGKFDFPGLVWGKFTLQCAAVGRWPLSKPNLELSPSQPLAVVEMVLPAESVVRQQAEVHARAGSIPEEQTGAPPASFRSEQLMTLPLAELNFKAALPLVPGVVRTPDGKLNIKGEPETNGLLLVDSAAMADPVTGSFSVEVPIDAIESLEVYKSPYQAQYGRFSGGLTVIQTKPPANQWRSELNDIIPDFFIEGGHLRGIRDAAPRLYFTGPLVEGKLNVSQSLIYDFDRQFVEGLPWPKNLRKREGWTSFTNFQYVFSPRHLLSANLRLFPKREQFANINALIPQPASENYGQNGYALGASDHYLFSGGGVLTMAFEVTEFNTRAYGQGPEDMQVGPNGFAGNYFNAFKRWSSQEEFQGAYQVPQRPWHGNHQLEIGVDLFRRSYTGTSESHPVLVTDAAGAVLERIEFSGPASLAGKDTESGGFAQDHWLMNGHLSVDAGLRYRNETIGSHTAFAPRLGIAYSPGSGGRTVIHAGFGIFHAVTPLLAADFPENPTRTISSFSPQGTLIGPPLVFRNAYGVAVSSGPSIIPSPRRPDTTPYEETESLELDQELRPGWLLRLNYLSSSGSRLWVLRPQIPPGQAPELLLSNTGRSHYQEFVSTMRVRTQETAVINFSYVWSRARGDLNALDQIYIPYEQPIIRPDFFGNSASDIPSRFIAWSEIHLPGAMTLSPLFDIHSGFPFSELDARQNYVGVPNRLRLPHFHSFDLKWTKEFHMSPLRLAFFRQHVFRAGVGVFDITDRLNPLNIYNNLASPYFGHLTGFQHRSFATYFDMVK